MHFRSEVFLNTNDHIFDLSFNDILMLCNYARSNKFNLCSMIGGAESIRDLQESKSLFVEAYEFSIIESIFAIKKIFNALEKTFLTDQNLLGSKKCFINISSKMGLEMIDDIQNLEIPKFISRKNLIFNFDRRSIIISTKLVNNNNFEVDNFEEKINNIISKKVALIKKSKFLYSISGGITQKSIINLSDYGISPDYIKTGLFTIRVGELDSNLIKQINRLQVLEKEILSLMNKCIVKKHNYLNIREKHLTDFLNKA